MKVKLAWIITFILLTIAVISDVVFNWQWVEAITALIGFLCFRYATKDYEDVDLGDN